MAPQVPAGALTPATAEEIQDLLGVLLPSPVLSSTALFYFGRIELYVGQGRLTRAQGNALRLINIMLRANELGLLNDPPGSQTTEGALAELIELLYEFVGLGDIDIPHGALTEEGAFAICGKRGCRVVTGTEFAGVNIPRGALDHDVIVLIERLDDFDPPLDTDMDQYPLFYRFRTIPETTFHGHVHLGLCVVDPPDPYAPPNATVANRLRLAHPHNGDIQILPLANVPFLDCDGAQTDTEVGMPEWLAPVVRLVFPAETYLRPLARIFQPDRAMANPGNLGAAASSFSPFAAVDPESGNECGEFCETF